MKLAPAVALLLVAACRPVPATVATPCTAPSGRVGSPAAGAPLPSGDTPDPAERRCPEDDTACACAVAQLRDQKALEADRLACAEGLSAARVAAGARRFDDAIGAVDATLERCSRAPSAELLAVRGGAKLSRGRAADALRDLDAALDSEADAARAAQLLWQRGDALNALGQSRAADESFYWSHRLDGSPQAASRLPAPGFCPLRVTHGERATIDHGWLAWWHRRAAGAPEGTAFVGMGEPPVITDDGSVRAALGPALSGPAPWIVAWRFPDSELRIVATRGESVLDFGVVGRALFTMTALARPHAYNDDVKVSHVGRFTVVHATHVARQVFFGPVVPHECDPSASPDWVALSSHETETYLVVDVARGLIMTRVELDARYPATPEDEVSSAKVTVTLKPGVGGFEVSEPACSWIAYEAP